jgi:hypothetical protein
MRKRKTPHPELVEGRTAEMQSPATELAPAMAQCYPGGHCEGAMRRAFLTAIIVALSACTTPREPDRVVFGVAGDRAASDTTPASDDAMRQFLDAKVNRVCTLGYETVKVETLPAEDNHALVDEQVRCSDYSLRLLPWDIF